MTQLKSELTEVTQGREEAELEVMTLRAALKTEQESRSEEVRELSEARELLIQQKLEVQTSLDSLQVSASHRVSTYYFLSYAKTNVC